MSDGLASSVTETTDRIATVTLDEQARIRRSPQVEHELRVALFDLQEDNVFCVKEEGCQGPYHLHLAVEENRILFTVNDTGGAELTQFSLPAGSFRSIIKEYFLICDSYFKAIKTASPSKIEAIDMGRRGVHNDGAELLRERLAEKVTIDKDTARRLFTVVAVLHIRA